MTIREQMKSLIDQMLDGQILLPEAVAEFEKLYIQKALKRNKEHFSNTAESLGIHRNTLSKKAASYNADPTPPKPLLKRRAKGNSSE